MHVIPIGSLNDPGLEPYAALTERQLRRDGLVIAESAPVIQLALEHGLTPVSMLMDARHAAGKAAKLIAECPGIPVYTGDEEQLKSLTGYALTRGILCALRRGAPREERDVLTGKRFALMCGLTDGANVGALFRSAAALGADGVLLSPDCCDPLTRKAVRTSMGSVFALPWAFIGEESWPDPLFALLGEKNIAAAAMTLRPGSVPLDRAPWPEGAGRMIVLGPEGPGLPKPVEDLCPLKVHIPMKNGIDSLNVAAAGAVAFWQAFRKEDA